MLRGRSAYLTASILALAALAMSACGGGGAAADNVDKPTPGGLVSPTAANAFLNFPRSIVRLKNGDYLVADAGNYDRTGAKVVKFSPTGKPLWVYTGGLVFPHSAYPMANGNIVISDTGNDRVIEVNQQGKIVWNTDNFGGGKGLLGQGKLSNGMHLLYPNDAYPMQNGNLLISSRFHNAVYEVTPKGKVTWSCARFMFRQHNPRLLPNGNLIVADSDNARGLIINHACNKILFDYDPGPSTLEWPRTFQPIGQNYVIGNSIGGDILEIGRKKHIVQKWRNLPTPFYVTVLKNGDVLTQDTNIHGVIELLPNGTAQKVFSTTDPNTYPKAIVNPGFENTGPKGWHQGDLLTESLPAGVRADMKFDTSNHHTGSSSGMISWPTNTPHLPIFWYETLSVKAGNTYNFDGWIKTDKVAPCAGCDQGPGTSNPGDALFYVQFNNPHSIYTTGQSGYFPGFTATGTTPWTGEPDQFTVPSGVKTITVECMLTGMGTVWFDDVTVKDAG